MAENMDVEVIEVSSDCVEVMSQHSLSFSSSSFSEHSSDISLTSSIFGWDCDICWGTAFDVFSLEEAYLDEQNIFTDKKTGYKWIRCYRCPKAYHVNCWLIDNDEICAPFQCCK